MRFAAIRHTTIMADVKSEKDEFKLASEMKKNFCDKTGKEINVAKTTNIIHKIGLIYRSRTPDKISLIKCVGLLNAAIFRNPSNVFQIKFELMEVCKHILQQANTMNQNADLLNKAEEAKASMAALRKEVKTFMKNSVPNIPTNVSRKNLQ